MPQEYTGEVVPLSSTGPKEYSGEVIPLDKKPGMIKEFWDTLTSESPSQIMKHGGLGSLGTGMGRQMGESARAQGPEQYKKSEPPTGFRHATTEEFRQNKQPYVRNAPKQDMGEVLSQAKNYMVEHPGATVAEFAKGIMADPELLLPMFGELGAGAKLSQVLGKLGKTAGTVGRVVGGAGEAGAKGAVIGAGIEAASQYGKNEYNPEAVASAAIITGAFSSFLGLRRNMFDPKELGSGEISDATAKKILDQYNEKRMQSEANGQREYPEMGLQEVKQRMLGELGEDSRVNAKQTAYRLMQEGASTAKVEAEVKRNPIVEQEMNKIRASRKEFTSRFGMALEGEVLRPDGTFGPNALTKMLHKGPTASAAELAARDAAAGITRDALGTAVKVETPREASTSPFRGGGRSQRGAIDMQAMDKALGDALRGSAATLGVLLSASGTTLKTLERLPQNKLEFTKTQIKEQLRRPDISAPERAAIESVLGAVDGDKISAKQLAAGVKVATGDFELTKSPTGEYAGHGLENIKREGIADSGVRAELDEFGGVNREALDAMVWDDPSAQSYRDKYLPFIEAEEKYNPQTRVWQLPEHLQLSDANHFSDPRYFGHTRSFTENGTRHVVEIQSDLAQKRTYSEAERSEFMDRINELDLEYGILQGKLRAASQGRDPKAFEEHRKAIAENNTKAIELNNKVDAPSSESIAPIAPMLKDWHKRLIREELADAARAGERTVRFADADTVAKVEDWERYNTSPEGIKQYQKAVSDSEKILEDVVSGKIPPEGGESHAEAIRAAKEVLDIDRNTLSRVEQGFQFEPDLQGIYDRYKGDVSKFLKQLGGVEVKDEHGHGWIEVPVEGSKAMPAGKRVAMFGKADPDFLLKIGAVTGGALVASRLADEDKLEAAIAGGAIGLALTMLPKYIDYARADLRGAIRDGATAGGVVAGATVLDREHPVEGAMIGVLWGSTKMLPKSIIPKIGNMSIDDIINLRNGSIAARERETSNLAWAIREAIPDKARREQLSRIIESGDIHNLAPAERAVAAAYKKFTDSIGEAGQDVGVLKDLVENYVSHIVEKVGAPKSKLGEAMEALFGSDTQPNVKPSQHRKYATFDELQKAIEGTGLKVSTLDLAEIVDMYGRSMGRAIENKKMVNNLLAAEEGSERGSSHLIMNADDAPPGYKSIQSYQMRGKMVHPDLAPSLKFVLEGKTTNDLVNGALALSTAQKRIAVGLSLFHANNLFNAYVGATGRGPIHAKRSVDAALKAYREGGTGDIIDTLIKNGLRVERPMEVDQSALAKVGAVVDDGIRRATGFEQHVGEKSLHAIEDIQTKTFDRLTWDYLHTGMKLAVGIREFERLTLANKDMPKAEVARQVSSFVNDTFGGLDWYRVATESQTQLGRKLGLAALSPNGRVALQIGMFAPDWTLSTFRAMYKALPGATEMPLTQKLHQKYVMRTGLLWGVLMNGINMQTAGHPIWDNKDPTRLEYKDGTSQQIMKHAMEGPEWLLHPRQTALNKLGAIPALAGEIATSKEYLSPHWAPPLGSVTEHVIKKMAPISLSGSGAPGRDIEERAKRAALGAAGFPVYGAGPEEKERAKEIRRDMEQKKKRKKEYGQ
ncbi:hypothetical protein UFOVP2_46 [uncultured Caudovirales phage]|uniref:Large polyvalent protein associated domain-containing protein n=1 Tax=uncultured Caudovirales phage TaxID=2100421 RepID=A0A6J5KG23_9CAUD|nr:hypothetical protein UFOVP2_46 [uncultured Caudovirales phage]